MAAAASEQLASLSLSEGDRGAPTGESASGNLPQQADPLASNNDGGMPLSVMFARGQAAFRDLDNGVKQESVKRGIEALAAAWQATRRIGLFSRNESKEDISTMNLKYVLTPYYLGELLSQRIDDNRLVHVKEAAQNLEGFLTMCEDYDLMSEIARISYKRDVLPDPMTQRNEKIARFKLDKQIAARLDPLEEKRKARRKQRGGEDDDDEDEDEEDEEGEREAWLLRIEAASLKAVDNLKLLQQEAQLLERRPREISSGPLDPSRQQQQQQQQQRGTGPGIQTIHIPAGLATATAEKLVGDRSRFQQGVFKPSHILPTMTVEEWGEREMQRMQAEQRSKAQAEAARIRERNMAVVQGRGRGESDDEEDEEQLKKTRAFDDWKDDHPYGSGNSKLRPCPS